ncbi:hypothetical protein BDV41DRAFT_545291 [Aspergillus transmontanensis]|uniref:Uncharacterized protein n=1 Tax=Aspergillus transmontanensis TaxID=1034304 RepID=A0A5N6VQZ6_9EURO|nr:hypothetical protein BDV41DRAFT_545291 [Aspergillus transmontanensis]
MTDLPVSVRAIVELFLLICDFLRIFLFLFSFLFSLMFASPRVLNHGFRPCRLNSAFHDSIQVPALPSHFNDD